MPVQACQRNYKKGFKWGSKGFCYTYDEDNEQSKKDAKKNALLQGYAIGEYNEEKDI